MAFQVLIDCLGEERDKNSYIRIGSPLHDQLPSTETKSSLGQCRQDYASIQIKG